MMMIPKWGNYPGDGGGGITLVIDMESTKIVSGKPGAVHPSCTKTRWLERDHRYADPISVVAQVNDWSRTPSLSDTNRSSKKFADRRHFLIISWHLVGCFDREESRESVHIVTRCQALSLAVDRFKHLDTRTMITVNYNDRVVVSLACKYV